MRASGSRSSTSRRSSRGKSFASCYTVAATCVSNAFSRRVLTSPHLAHDELQEKSYNPYYTFVGQHLCRSSHSYKVTLQFCLWDFLRDLGETNVGGAEVIKNLKDDAAVGFDVKKISSSRMRNVARAYAWWVAKDAISLAVFKVRLLLAAWRRRTAR